MYYYMDMAFASASACPDFGSIKMCFRSKDRLGTASDGTELKLRNYVFLSDDFSKLSNIVNAADGSEACATDTGKTYILCANQWREWTGSGGGGGGSSLKWSHF